MFGSIRTNLHRWQYTLAGGPQPGVQQGQFRHTQTGQLLRTRQAAQAGDATVPAWVCETEPQTGAIRVTDEPATLPADARQSELCSTICLVCSDAEVTQTTKVLLQAKRRRTPNMVTWPQCSQRRQELSDTQRSAPGVHPRFQTLECWSGRYPKHASPKGACASPTRQIKMYSSLILPKRGGSHALSPLDTPPCSRA